MAKEDSKVEEAIMYSRIPHTQQTKVTKEDNTSHRVTQTKMVKGDPIPRTMGRLLEVMGIRITWVVGVHPGSKECKATEATLELVDAEL